MSNVVNVMNDAFKEKYLGGIINSPANIKAERVTNGNLAVSEIFPLLHPNQLVPTGMIRHRISDRAMELDGVASQSVENTAVFVY